MATPGVTLFAGYLDDPATTAASFRDGWFLTGDRARRDASGRFFFDGRRADVLKVAGENVSTVEVEQVLVGAPGRARGGGRRACPTTSATRCRSASSSPPTRRTRRRVDELHAWCAERLTKSKRPRDITLVDELPRTSVGKIRKFLLKDPNAEAGDATPANAETSVHV